MDEFVTSIVAIIAAKGADALITGGTSALGALVRLIRKRFGDDTQEEAVLRAAIDHSGDRQKQTELARVLDSMMARDTDFDRAVRWHWQRASAELTIEAGGAINHFSGTAGKLVQARDIGGDLHL